MDIKEFDKLTSRDFDNGAVKDEIRKSLALLEDGRILTCVYCGHEYPQDTPSAGSEILTEHIKVCEKHPMRKCESDRDKLRKALTGLIGTDKLEELDKMEAFIRLTPAPEVDKIASINAITALKETSHESNN